MVNLTGRRLSDLGLRAGMATIIRGRVRDDDVIAAHLGEPVRFSKALGRSLPVTPAPNPPNRPTFQARLARLVCRITLSIGAPGAISLDTWTPS